ncbi:hypothetical protein [Specibacter sp. NPDC078692]|uniref:hypothetical protein n=1 Tax=Specibacter sp. NPDC078692 TaxID=3155818 RepID=UPI0034444C93
MAAIVRPSERVAARRRQAFLYAPLLVFGAVIGLAGGSMIDVFNGLDVIGLACTVVGLLGFVREMDKR